MKHITIIAMPRTLGSGIAIPLEMLSAANDIARAGKQKDKLITIEVASTSGKGIKLSGGLNIECDTSLDQIEHTDLIIVPGTWGNPRSAIARNPEIPDWILKHYHSGATICSIVTGSHFVAETGLLDDEGATTHWRFFDLFKDSYPKVKLQRKRFISSANNIYCTGSINASRDIMLHLIEQFYGKAISNEVSRHFTHELKPSYESMLLTRNQESTHHDETIIEVQEWLQENHWRQIQLGDIARQFKISIRSLNRRFKFATNTTPLQYLQDLRINQAKELLKQSNLAISEVADKVGYQDASYFTGLFKKINAITPNEYRKLVRNKLFVVESNSRPIQ